MAEIQKLASDDLKIDVLIEEEKITLSGLKIDVLTAENQIKDVILNVEKVRKEFFQFEWGYLSGSDVELYPEKISFKLEEAFKSNAKKIKFETADGRTLVVDFNDLVEYYEDNIGDVARVVRKDKYSSAGKFVHNIKDCIFFVYIFILL